MSVLFCPFCEESFEGLTHCPEHELELVGHGRVLVVVEDTGPGIPDQALTKVFKRFYSERPPGQFGEHSGLGLAISRQIVEELGGEIDVESKVGVGTSFVVRLPLLPGSGG